MTKSNGNNNVDPRLKQRMEQVSAGGQLAIVLCANSFRFGGNWAFLRSNKADFRENLTTLKEEQPNVKAIPVSNGALILVNENFLAHNVNKIVPNAIGGAFVDKVTKRRNEEKERFVKFLKSVASGKSSHVKAKGGYYELILGVYSTNDTNHIRLNGIDYPAYKLSMIEAIDYADAALSSSGRKVYARAITDQGKEVFDIAKNLGFNSKGLAALYKGLEISESDTGLFLTLRIV